MRSLGTPAIPIGTRNGAPTIAAKVDGAREVAWVSPNGA